MTERGPAEATRRAASRGPLAPSIVGATPAAVVGALVRALVVGALALGCGASGGGAREGSVPGVLAPAAFVLDLRGMGIALEATGAVRAEGCEASLDFASATLTAPDGRVLARLRGDAWPRALVVGEGEPPVTVSEREVVAGGRTLFLVGAGGALLDAGGGVAGPVPIAAHDLAPDEATTALALLALVPACWEDAAAASPPGE